jgi:hypothetical protein
VAVGERTYTFRAAGDLGNRIRAASASLAGRPELLERLAAELGLAIARDPTRFHASSGNQSAFMRDTIELLVGATEKVAADAEYAKLYAEAAAERSDEEIEFRRAVVAEAARRWRDA